MIPVDGCSEHRVPCMLRCIGIGAIAVPGRAASVPGCTAGLMVQDQERAGMAAAGVRVSLTLWRALATSRWPRPV